MRKKEMIDIPEETLHTRINEQVILHAKKIPILDKSGAPKYLLGIAEDITRRKKMEQELRASKRNLHIIFDSVYDAIFLHDLTGESSMSMNRC